jgi:hypothetical protein
VAVGQVVCSDRAHRNDEYVGRELSPTNAGMQGRRLYRPMWIASIGAVHNALIVISTRSRDGRRHAVPWS